MLSTPHKRFVYARSERFPDFSEASFFRVLLERHRREEVILREQQARSGSSSDFSKPAPWTPWLWIKP
jgi:hypothetical protein